MENVKDDFEKIKEFIKKWLVDNELHEAKEVRLNKKFGNIFVFISHNTPGALIGTGGNKVKDLCKKLSELVNYKVKIDIK